MIRAFNEMSFNEFKQGRFAKIKEEIQSKEKEYILNIDQNEFAEYLYHEYLLYPLKIDQDSESIEEPTKSKEQYEDRLWEETRLIDVYTFNLKYNFTGSPILFKIRPNPWNSVSGNIEVDEYELSVSFSFKMYKLDAEEFKKNKNRHFQDTFLNLDKLNNNLQEINDQLLSTIVSYILAEKKKYQEENDFFSAINIRTNRNTESVFTAPTIKRKIIPQPKVPQGKEFTSEPTMSQKMYDDVLKVVYDSGKSMEKKPALYQNKDEEGLRDQFLFVLETRYIGIAASGETFNRAGKTDILLKYAADGTNVFVAECKFWHGASGYLKAISQLFDRYLSWRDSKVAIIIFVTNNDFSNVLKIIKQETSNHQYFVKQIGERGESSFTYEFRLAQDAQKPVLVEVMAFHYDKKKS